MGSAEITIVKRDGKKESFTIDKIKNAIRKAFLSVGGFATEDDLTNILSRLRINNGMSVEEIQNQVEIALMEMREITDLGIGWLINRIYHPISNSQLINRTYSRILDRRDYYYDH